MRIRHAVATALLAACAAGAWAGSYDDYFRAIRRDDPRAVTQLLLRGFDADTLDPEGRSGLHLAIQLDAFVAADALLGAPKIDVDAPNAKGETALMLAAIKGQLALCQRLVARGAAVNRSGWSPLHYAASGPEARVVYWLLAQGAAADAGSPNGTTPLMMAAGYGSFAAVDALLAAGADARRVNQQGRSAADFALAAGRDKLAERLRRR